MQQLPLEVRLGDHAVFESFYPAGNEALVEALREIAGVRRQAMLWLWGAPGTGRSHLLQSTVARADQLGASTAYVPLARAGGLPAAVLEGLETRDVVCLDDLHEVAGDVAWERALFMLWEALRQSGARLVVAADRSPTQVRFGLPDLASRLASGATYRVHPLDDEQRLRALQHRAAWRGLTLPEDAARYLLSRLDRSPERLFRYLDELDRASLAARKSLTIPFVKTVFGL